MAVYLYRPLAASDGALRCVGIVSDSALADHPERFTLASGDYAAGAFISSEYLGASASTGDYRLTRLFTEAELLSMDRCYAIRKASGALFRDEVRRAAQEELRYQR